MKFTNKILFTVICLFLISATHLRKIKKKKQDPANPITNTQAQNTPVGATAEAQAANGKANSGSCATCDTGLAACRNQCQALHGKPHMNCIGACSEKMTQCNKQCTKAL